MDRDTIFTVTNEHLDLLNDRTAVEFFQKLLWAEARRLGIEGCKINVSNQSNVRDGRIDATVDAAQFSMGLGIIKPGKTSYQIKAGSTFKPWRKQSVIKEELFGKKTPERENLGESVRACLYDGGTYVLVCTGIDLVDCDHRNARNHITEYLEDCGYSEPKVEVWSQNTLRCFLESFPSLCLWVNGRDSAKFQTHDSWSRNANMQGRFVSGESQDELIENIRSDLRRDDDTAPLLVSGQPGIGKTRLVLEATRAEDLAPQVIYSPADQFLQDKFLMDELCNDENDFCAIVVIDDCNLHSRSEILDKLKHRGPNIKLLTIYNNHEEAAGDIRPYVPQRLSDDQIRSIIKQHTNNSDKGDRRWVELCSGSPRVADVVGWNRANYPKDVLASLSTVNLWERYIVSVDDPSQERTEQRRRVLRYMSLFKQFGFEDPVGEEAETVAKRIQEADPQITWTIFQEIVDNLKKRRILDGDYTLAITPKALQIKLWIEWWDIYGRTFVLEEFMRGLSPRLAKWFYEMFRYAAGSGVALSAVEYLLGPNGPFRKSNHLQTSLGSRFFLALTEAAPESALECLSCTVGTLDRESLLRFKEGRREVIIALQKIAVWRDSFANAARLLLALGEAENEGFSNNASGVFAELFSPAPGGVAPTEASPKERFPILEGAIESESKAQRALALEACAVALESRYFSRVGSPEYQGLRPKPRLWTPKTEDEFQNALRRVWKLLDRQLAHLPEDERKKGASIQLGRARGIGRLEDLADMVVKSVAKIENEAYADKKQVIKTVNAILRYEGQKLSSDTRELWEQFLGKLVTPDFHSMMQRYVGMELLEDLQRDTNGVYVDRAQPQIESLAQRAAINHSLLHSELDWLVTTEAKRGYQFGYELGKRDNDFSLLSTLLKAQRNTGDNSSTAFLGGYFHACFELDRPLWETQIASLIDDTKLKLVIPALTSRSGLTDQTGLCLLNLARNGAMSVNDFKTFVDSTAVSGLSGEVFGEWIMFLLNVANKVAISIALALYYRYYILQTPSPVLPRDLTFRLLSNPLLFKESDDSEFDDTVEHEWTEIAREYIKVDSQKHLELAEFMLSHFGQDGSIFGPYSQTWSVLDEITEKFPARIWKQVSWHLENEEYSSRKFALEQWLREGSSLRREEAKPPLLDVPHELIWVWIDIDPEYRAWYFAERLVPKTLSTTEWEDSIVRGLLIRYGAREDVRSSLRANYYSETYWGPSSLHYEEKIRKLLDIKNCEDNQNVKRWIDEFVEELEGDIERAKIDEERQF